MKLHTQALIAAAFAGACMLSAGAQPAVSAVSYGVSGYVQDWYAPPGELNEIQRRGFVDGVEGARKDFGNHRRPDVNNRDEYRHPHLPERDREAYRVGFERGYRVGVRHLYGEGRY